MPANGSGSASRCCASRERNSGERSARTYETNPGEVWEEAEFWVASPGKSIPDGSLGIRRYFESPYRRASRSRWTSTTAGCSSTPCPACRKPPRESSSRRCSTCAGTASFKVSENDLQPRQRAAAHRGGAGRHDGVRRWRKRPARREGRRGHRRRRGACGIPHAVAQAWSSTHRRSRVELARAWRPALSAEPRALARPGAGRSEFDLLPTSACPPHAHAVGGEVALRDLAHATRCGFPPPMRARTASRPAISSACARGIG